MTSDENIKRNISDNKLDDATMLGMIFILQNVNVQDLTKRFGCSDKA